MTDNALVLPIAISQQALQQFCTRYHIRKLSLFGSVLRSDFTPQSDIDCLVEFKADYMPTLLALARMERELSPLMENRKIDLRTPEELSPYFRDKVMREAVVQYDGN